jgi:lipoate-protein ligase A
MAFDRLLMEQVRLGRWDFVLRTYGWTPACVSIGKLQDASREINREAIEAAGYGLVRRPTGGRAVWHETEVTYSVTARIDHPMVTGHVSEALRKVAAPMADAIRRLGIAVSLSPLERHHHAGPREGANPCFTSHGSWEVGTADGRKLVGSAQARSRGVFLEHGSILLENDQPKLLDFLPIPVTDETKARLASLLTEGIATLREFVPGLRSSDVEAALAASFGAALEDDLSTADPAMLHGPELDALILEQEHV